MQTVLHVPCVSLFPLRRTLPCDRRLFALYSIVPRKLRIPVPLPCRLEDRDVIIKRQSFYIKRFTFDERRTNVKRLK